MNYKADSSSTFATSNATLTLTTEAITRSVDLIVFCGSF